jgi:hypothetical protein
MIENGQAHCAEIKRPPALFPVLLTTGFIVLPES